MLPLERFSIILLYFCYVLVFLWRIHRAICLAGRESMFWDGYFCVAGAAGATGAAGAGAAFFSAVAGTAGLLVVARSTTEALFSFE